VRWGLVPRNVTAGVEAPRPAKNAKKEMHPLTPEQARTLLEAARGERLENLYGLAITTGLRQGEIFGLRWQDVDLKSGTQSVATICMGECGYSFSRGDLFVGYLARCRLQCAA
jgi:integrase